MTHRGFESGSPTCLQPHRNRLTPGGDSRWPFGAKARLVAALLAVVSGAACGGGVASSTAQPSVQVTPSSLTFGSQAAGTTSTAQTVTLADTGTTAVNITGVSISGDFSQTNNCPGALGAGSSCSFQVVFTPTATGTRTGTLSISTTATSTAQTVSLTGAGAGPSVQVSPGTLTFGSQAVGTSSAAQTVTLENTGTTAINITGVSITGDFSQTSNCPSALGAGSSCSFQVVFTPTVTGTRTGTLSISTTATSTAQTVGLTGAGTGPLAGVFTQRYDNSRSGANTQEVFLTPANVNSSEFGKLFSLPVDGQVYAQPLYMENVSIPNLGVHNVVFVATEHNSVYAFDADGQSATPLWHVSFLNPSAGVTTVPSQDVGSNDLNPEIGITATPVIDPTSGTLYVTAKTKELQDPSCTSNCTYNYFHRLHALAITTGAEKLGGPVVISASVPGTGYDSVSGTVTFGALRHLQRPGLLLLSGTVYIGFGSHGDTDPYHGWLMAYNATTLQQTAVFNVTPNGERGAIWLGGGGISADAGGNLYVVTANGTFDANTGGTDYSDSVLKLQVQSGQFQVLDYFTPANQGVLETADLDLGSAPALILPDQLGPNPHLLATAGKDARLFILNRDNLGHQQAGDAGALQVIQDFSGQLFAGGTYWNGNLYFQAVDDFLKQFPLQNGTAQSPTLAAFQTGFPDPPPAVSANGTSNAILWVVQADAYGTGGPAVLHAFDATNIGNELYNSGQAPNLRDQAGPAVKFVVPTVVNGKVYVGTAGEVDVYGLLP